jgi:myo-inositol-1(or 4)-monophosphatase
MALMSTNPALEYDWLGACRRAAQGLQSVLRDHPTSIERVIETGETGGGGDRTLVIDAEAEDRVFEELERLHDAGARFTVVSEERGNVDFGGDGVLVVVDPIDGSLNAKRGLPHHALSVAVAIGPTMDDVIFGFVHDLGPGEEWRAVLGEGTYVNNRRVDHAPPERHTADGRLELLAVESADPRWLALASDDLVAATRRIRAMGSIAVSMCQVAATRVDAMASLARTRAVDCAASQLIVRESGGQVAFAGCPDGPLGAPLDLEPHYPVLAARTPESLERLLALPAV